MQERGCARPIVAVRECIVNETSRITDRETWEEKWVLGGVHVTGSMVGYYLVRGEGIHGCVFSRRIQECFRYS